MACPHPSNRRLIMTAPRPRLQRLLSDTKGGHPSSSTFDNGNPEEIIRKNLFAPPVVAQNEIFGDSKTKNHLPHRQMIYQRPPSSIAKQQLPQKQVFRNNNNNPTRGSINIRHRSMMTTQSLLRTPPKQHRPPRRRGTTCSKVTRTGSEQYCGLSAEITREINYRTPVAKQPHVSSKKTNNKKMGGGILKTPVSRDLFRVKTTSSSLGIAPAFKAPVSADNSNDMMELQLTPTASMSSASSSSDDGTSDRESSCFPYNMITQSTTKPNSSTGVTFALANANETNQKKRKKVVNLLDTTPKVQATKKQKIRKTPFVGKLSARKKLKKCLTPPRNSFQFGSHIKNASSRLSSAAGNTLLSLSTSFDGVENYRMTSSEYDPSPFQVELPLKKDVVVHSKVCSMMDGYTAIHRDFNFALLSGISRSTLEREYCKSTIDKPMVAGSCHRGVVRKLLECEQDVVVEGFFREYTEETPEKESERIEVVILSSERLRQIIVCFRGSTANQAKPLMRNTFLFGKQQRSVLLHDDQKVPVIDTFRSAYFGTSLEKTVFANLASLATRKPFFDIVMTGHSFGAAMATIASFRYAISKPQMRVSCNVFSSPRVGGEEWRQLVHSVPNLRIYRTENGADPCVVLPSGNEWVHCGHAVQISDLTGHTVGVDIKARRFDNGQANNGNLFGYVQALPKNITQVGSSHSKVDHEIQSYVEKLTRSGEKWFIDFCEVKGQGVSGANNEIRTLS